MSLLRLEEFDPHYRTRLGDDIQHFTAYSGSNEFIGRILDVLVNQAGHIQYLVVVISSGGTGKQVLLPAQQSQIDLQQKQIYVAGVSKAQAENLPPYSPVSQGASANISAANSVSYPSEIPESRLQRAEVYEPIAPQPQVEPDRSVMPERIAPQHQPPLQPQTGIDSPVMPERINHPASPPEVVYEETIPVLEERLVVNNRRQKLGEVIVRKEIETEIIEVPVQREKLIVEQVGDDPKKLAEIDLHQDDVPGPR